MKEKPVSFKIKNKEIARRKIMEIELKEIEIESEIEIKAEIIIKTGESKIEILREAI